MIDLRGLVLVFTLAFTVRTVFETYELAAVFAKFDFGAGLDAWLLQMDESQQMGVIVLCAIFWLTFGGLVWYSKYGGKKPEESEKPATAAPSKRKKSKKA